ncbi:hypothetical protein [Planomonospora alba]|uniref:hypothetical protein n=1 Tax=Planomonospora alba TaxID=161354 RepID=UPI0031E743E3
MDGEAGLRDAVERARLDAGLVIPPDYDAGIRAGRQVTRRYLTRPGDLGSHDVALWTRSVAAREAVLVRAAWFGAAEGAGTFDEGLAATGSASVPGLRVRVATAGDALFPEGSGAFSASAPAMLLMFVFLAALLALGAWRLRRTLTA